MLDNLTIKEYFFFIFYILFILIIIFLFIFRGKIFNIEQKNKNDSLKTGFGYYSEPESSGCLTTNGFCSEDGVEHLFQTCIPHPKTGNGCLDDNGRQTFDMIHSMKSCNKACVNKSMNVEIDKCVVIDRRTGLERKDFEDETCIPVNDPNIIGYYKKSYTCIDKDHEGTEGCKYTCGSEENISGFIYPNNFRKDDPDITFSTSYPYIVGNNLQKIQFCYDINGLDQLLPLKLSSECTKLTCNDYDKDIIKYTNKDNFIYPVKCYTKDVIVENNNQRNLIFDSTLFNGPRLIRDGKEVIGGGCFTERGTRKKKGETIYLNTGDVLEAYVPCKNFQKPICGIYSISNTEKTKFINCSQDLTKSHNDDSNINCYVENGSDLPIQKRFRKGIEKIDMNCNYNNISYNYCIKPRMNMLYDNSHEYNKGDVVYIEKDIVDAIYESSITDNLNNNPYYDGNYSNWIPYTKNDISPSSWSSSTNYNIGDKVKITTLDHGIKAKNFYRSLLDTNNYNPETSSKWENIVLGSFPYSKDSTEWSSLKYYNPGDIVFLNSSKEYFTSIKTSINKNPLTNKIYWSPYIYLDENKLTPINNYFYQGHLDEYLNFSNKNVGNNPLTEDTSCIKQCYFLDDNASTSSFNYPELLTGSFILRLVEKRNYINYYYVASFYNTPCSKDKTPGLYLHYDCNSSKDSTLYKQTIHMLSTGYGSEQDRLSKLNLNPDYCNGLETNQQIKTNMPQDLSKIDAANGLLFYFVPVENHGSSLKCKILVMFGMDYYGWLKYNKNITVLYDSVYNTGGNNPVVYFVQEKFNIFDKSTFPDKIIKGENYETDLGGTEYDEFVITKISNGKYIIKQYDNIGNVSFMTENMGGYNLQETKEGTYLDFVPAFSMDFFKNNIINEEYSYLDVLRSRSVQELPIDENDTTDNNFINSGCSLFYSNNV